MVHSDKPWLMMCDHAAFDCGSLLLFYFTSFSTQTTLCYHMIELGKGRNSITGNVQLHIHIFNKSHAHFCKSQSNHATVKLTTLDVR